ncbi:MAG: hypothetical protein QOE36_2968, partial [Gaiellaceae bacterium]|nr:hypothetical protein [Gaiellaceae bacterium]
LAQRTATLTDVVLASAGRTPTLAGVSVTPIRNELYLQQLLVEADIVVVEGGSAYGDAIAAHAPGLVVVDLAEQSAPREALLQRADVFVYRAAGRTPELAGATQVVAPDDESLLAQLRLFITEPWHWRRRGGVNAIVLPEDLRLLLARHRASSGGNGAIGAARRALWSRLPEPLQRAALRVSQAART